jgi:hypothetical protein
LIIKGGDGLSIPQVNICREGQRGGGAKSQKWDPVRCQCGPKVMEQWVGRTQGWQLSGPSERSLKYSQKTVKKLSKSGYVAMQFQVAKNESDRCASKDIRKVFKVGQANSSQAFVEGAFIFNAWKGRLNFPHIKIELLDDKGKVLGKQRYYSPAAVSADVKAEAKKHKYAPPSSPGRADAPGFEQNRAGTLSSIRSPSPSITICAAGSMR